MSTASSPLDSRALLSNGLSSAAAGIIGRCLTHPLDTAKARLQASSSSSSSSASASNRIYTGSFQVLATTLRQEGIRGWYRGFGVVVSLGTPGTVLYLSTYEIAKERLHNYQSTAPDWAVHLASGMLAETIACIVYVPVDVVKERMQVQQQQQQQSLQSGGNVYYKNTIDAMKQISQAEGLRGLYRGYAATLLSFGPFSALYFVFYERCKLLARNYEAHGDFRTDRESHSPAPTDLSFRSTLLCSASAGAAASWITSPLDLAKLRLQVSRSQQLQSGENPAYRGVVDCLQHAFQQGGVRGLFRGAFARVLHFAPATTITMTSYETCRSFISGLLHVDEI